MKKITVTEKELDNQDGGGGLEINIPGIQGNSADTLEQPIFIEKYDGEIRLVVWNGGQDPQIINLKRTPATGQVYTKISNNVKFTVSKVEDGIVSFSEQHFLCLKEMDVESFLENFKFFK